MNLSDRNDADWKNTLRKGLSFVIDTADEYQVKNIIDKNAPVEVMTSDAFDAYKDYEEDNSFTIMLKTRSATTSDLVQSKLIPLNCRPCSPSSAGRGRLRHDGHQGHQGDGGVPGTGTDDHQVSD